MTLGGSGGRPRRANKRVIFAITHSSSIEHELRECKMHQRLYSINAVALLKSVHSTRVLMFRLCILTSLVLMNPEGSFHTEPSTSH